MGGAAGPLILEGALLQGSRQCQIRDGSHCEVCSEARTFPRPRQRLSLHPLQVRQKHAGAAEVLLSGVVAGGGGAQISRREQLVVGHCRPLRVFSGAGTTMVTHRYKWHIIFPSVQHPFATSRIGAGTHPAVS